jgi:hypothetical protein
VRCVNEIVRVERLRLREIGEVRCRALAVGLRGLVVAADSLHDVRGHVLEVAGSWHHAAQTLRGGDTPSGVGRRFDGMNVDGMNVVVVRARMPGVLLTEASITTNL